MILKNVYNYFIFLLITLFFLILFINFSHGVYAQENYNSWNNAVDKKINIENMRMLEIDKFRIFYFTSGPNVIDKTDKDKNNIPDYVEDVSKQLWATNHIFTNILGFTSPLNAPYYNGVSSIDVYILSRDHLKGTLGMAFTSPEQAPLKKKGVNALKIFVAKGLDFRNTSTIPHEFFHLIQNGFSRIANTWYLEGLARWAENILSKKKYFVDPNWNYEKILKSKNVLNHIQTLSYKSGQFFWIPLTIKFGESSRINLASNDLLNELRYSNGSLVLQDKVFYGADIINYFLIALNNKDKLVMQKYNFNQWDREISRNPRNNTFILEALKEAIEVVNIKNQNVSHETF